MDCRDMTVLGDKIDKAYALMYAIEKAYVDVDVGKNTNERDYLFYMVYELVKDAKIIIDSM